MAAKYIVLWKSANRRVYTRDFDNLADAEDQHEKMAKKHPYAWLTQVLVTSFGGHGVKEKK